MNIPPQFDTAEFRQVLVEFTNMRKKIRKPATDHAMNLILNKLIMWCGKDVDKAIAILNQSIERSWQGVFPLKTETVRKVDKIVPNGADEGQTWSDEEFATHIRRLLDAIENKEIDTDIPF